MDKWPYVVSGLLVLTLIGRRLTGSRMLGATALALAFVVVVLWLEKVGLWPEAWRR